MKEVLSLALSALSAICELIALRNWFKPKHTIPQSEIETEARRLIVEYGDGAVKAAEMKVQRSQWAKGKSDSPERAKRVLNTVRKKLK